MAASHLNSSVDIMAKGAAQ